MEKYFTIKKTDFVMIYGCGDLGTALANALTSRGYNVKYFIDQRAEELIEISGISVISPKSTKEYCSDGIVIVTLGIGILHDKIAEDFYSMGFDKIVFLPFFLYKSKKTRSEAKFKWNELVVNHNFDLDFICYQNGLFFNG